MVILFLFLFSSFSIQGFTEEHAVSSIEDLGVYGTLFEIEEEDLLDLIQKRLLQLQKNGDLKKYQEILVTRTKEKVLRPKSLSGITKAIQNRVFYYDPTLILSYDLKDHQGQIFQKKGTKVNPLTHVSLSKDLVFIDGEDKEQLAWVQKEYIETRKSLKVILIKGEPFKCEDVLSTPCYFDQEGVLTKKLGIKHVPTRVSQEGLLLRIEEHQLGEGA